MGRWSFLERWAFWRRCGNLLGIFSEHDSKVTTLQYTNAHKWHSQQRPILWAAVDIFDLIAVAKRWSGFFDTVLVSEPIFVRNRRCWAALRVLIVCSLIFFLERVIFVRRYALEGDVWKQRFLSIEYVWKRKILPLSANWLGTEFFYWCIESFITTWTWTLLYRKPLLFLTLTHP